MTYLEEVVVAELALLTLIMNMSTTQATNEINAYSWSNNVVGDDMFAFVFTAAE